MSPSMVTAPEADYSPAGAMSSMENSTDLHPQWSAPSLLAKDCLSLLFKTGKAFFTCGNSKFISESLLVVCMNKALLTGLIQSYDKA